MLDPTWTRDAGYSHVANLMAIVSNTTRYPAEKIRWRDTQASSNVVAVGWDSEMRMYVHYVHGGVYMYSGVSRQRAVACSLAKSVGRYLNMVIKPNYKAVKVA